MSVLDGIVARTRADVAVRKTTCTFDDLSQSDRDFHGALRSDGLSLIAEIKHRSPSRGVIREDFDPAAIARAYDRGASAISVLTDAPHFGGQHAFVGLARAACTRPLLAKDFFIDAFQIREARAAGADAILLMASVLDAATIESFLGEARALGMDALVEVHSEAELDAVLGETSARIVGVNSRDLTTLKIDDATIFDLAPRVRAAGKVMVAESGVFERAQVDRLRDVADAVLIGTGLMMAADLDAKIHELGW